MDKYFFEIPQSSDAIARAWDISPATLSRWISGERKPTGDNTYIWEDINLCFRYDPKSREWIPRD